MPCGTVQYANWRRIWTEIKLEKIKVTRNRCDLFNDMKRPANETETETENAIENEWVSEQETEVRKYGTKHDTRRKLTHAILRPNEMNEAVKAPYNKKRDEMNTEKKEKENNQRNRIVWSRNRSKMIASVSEWSREILLTLISACECS